MKNTICTYATVLLFVSSLFLSCSKNDDDNIIEDNNSLIQVAMTITVDGILSSTPIVKFNDKDGKEKNEILTGNWDKVFSVKPGYKLYLKTIGTIEGSVAVKVTATGNGNNINKNINENGNPKDFDITVQETLK